MTYKIKSKKLKPKTRAWSVSLNRKQIDKVFYNGDISKEEVKKSLVNHDGYDPEIKLNEDKKWRKY